MIYDCFMFYNENDVLDIRFEELYPVVDKFVIVQGSKTFRGNDKPDYLDHSRFEKYADKIRRVQHSSLITGKEPEVAWEREKAQRNAIRIGLWDAEPDDIIIVSDADEIPKRSVIDGIEPVGIDALMMKVFIGGINVLSPNRHTIRVCRFSDYTTAQEVRQAPLGHVYENAGWEFSSLGTPEMISEKLKAFSHWELDSPEITNPAAIYKRMLRGEDPYGFGYKYECVTVDDTWPEAVKNNRDYWRKYEC